MPTKLRTAISTEEDRRPRIMLDLDGTVYQWERTARYLLRRWYLEQGLGVPEELSIPSTHYDYISTVVCPEAFQWLWSEGVERGLFRYGHIYTGASEAVHALAELGELHVITKRPPNAVNDTLDWLTFQRWPISNVITLTERGDKKSDVKPLCDVYIDDALEVLEDLHMNTSGAYVIAVDRPWNQGAPCDARAYSWDGVLEAARRALG